MARLRGTPGGPLRFWERELGHTALQSGFCSFAVASSVEALPAAILQIPLFAALTVGCAELGTAGLAEGGAALLAIDGKPRCRGVQHASRVAAAPCQYKDKSPPPWRRLWNYAKRKTFSFRPLHKDGSESRSECVPSRCLRSAGFSAVDWLRDPRFAAKTCFTVSHRSVGHARILCHGCNP